AVAVVSDSDPHGALAGAVEATGNAHFDGALFADGIDAVDQEVGKDLAQFSANCGDFWMGTELLFDLDVFAGDFSLDQIGGSVEHRIHADLAGGGGLAIKPEGLPRDVGYAAELSVGLFEVLASRAGKTFSMLGKK